MTGRSLRVDIAARFLKLLTGLEDAVHTFRILQSKNGRVKACKLYGRLSELARPLSLANSLGAAITVQINHGAVGKSVDANIDLVWALFLDLDGADPTSVLRAPVSPHVLVETSPGRHHAYWKVADFPVGAFRGAQRALAAYFGGDPSVSNPSRVMRLPGSYHMKGDPFLTWMMLYREGPPLSLDELLDAFPFLRSAVESPPRADSVPRAARDAARLRGAAWSTRLGQPSSGLTSADRAALAVAESVEGTRHTTLFRMACRLGFLAANGVVRMEHATTELIDAGLRSGLPEFEVTRTVRDGLRRGAAGRPLPVLQGRPTAFSEVSGSVVALPSLTRFRDLPKLDDSMRGTSWD